MATNRSPNYPRISLGEAVQRVGVLFKKEGRSKLEPQGVAAVLGYSSYNGSAQGVISALRKYGLLAGKGDELTISEDALAILHGEKGTRERAEAFHRAALGPELFSELRREFPDSLPSVDNLRYRLIKKRFTEAAANVAARTYRETWELVTAEAEGYHFPLVESVEETEGDDPMPQPSPSAGAPAAGAVVTTTTRGPVTAAPPAATAGPGAILFQVPFRGTTLSVRIEASGQSLTREHVAR